MSSGGLDMALEGKIRSLIEMGFSRDSATRALQQKNGNVEEAAEYLLSEETAMKSSQKIPKSKLLRTSSKGIPTRKSVEDLSDMVDEDAAPPAYEDEGADQDEWFVDDDLPDAIEEFEVLEKDQLERLLNQSIDRIASELALSKGEAQLVLRHFNWNEEKLHLSYYDRPDHYLELAGVKHTAPADAQPTSGAFDCPVCLTRVPATETFAAPCGHRYCFECWQGNFSNALETLGQNVVGLKCMFPSCTARISFDMWKRLARPSDFERYWYFLVKDFVERNGKYVFCTNPSCGRAIHYRGAGRPPDIVECQCGQRFCFQCGSEVHSPVTCKQLKEWEEKNSSDQESLALVKATAKNCFHCGFPTERNQGCNHMTCSKCRGEWCWMCRGDWKTHGSHTGGFYSCNKYDSSDAKKLDDWANKYLEDSKRLQHYFGRYFNHATARRQLQAQAAQLRKNAFEYGVKLACNYDAVGEGIALVLECRQILKYTYVYGFFLAPDAKEQTFFEYLQANAEGITERLADLVIQAPEKIDLEDLKNRIRITRKFLSNLVDGIREGLVQV
eukprot:m51a1_g2977 hypothetical protein (557) ;mRNA; r:712891-715092